MQSAPNGRDASTFLDLVDALTCKHQELRDAYDALVEKQGSSMTQSTGTPDNKPFHEYIASWTTQDETPISLQNISSRERNISWTMQNEAPSAAVPTDECSPAVNANRLFLGASSAKQMTPENFDVFSFKRSNEDVLSAQCDRFEYLLKKLETHLGKANGKPAAPFVSLQRPKPEDKLQIGAATNRFKNIGSTSGILEESEIEAEEGVSELVSEAAHQLNQQKSRRFGIDWDGEEGQAKNNSARLSLASVLLHKSYLYRKDILDSASGIIIIAYVFFLGGEIELLSRGITTYVDDFFKAHMVFNSYFILELFIRLFDSGIKDFLTGKERLFNWLDLALVLSSIMDVAFKGMSTGSSRILRSIRVVRIVRMVRVFRAIAEVREFQKMLFAIASSMKTLLCALVILFFVLYFFAVIFTYGAIDARKSNVTSSDLDLYWGTFMMAIYTCFISVSTGQAWHDVLVPLSEYSVGLTLAFCAFISITLFGVMNAITSIFVESAINSSQYYRELIVADKEHEKEVAISHMKAVFRQIDEDDSGEITTAEMEYFLGREDLRKYLEALNISADDTRMLFRLLDTDDSHVIDATEFCDGCLKLKGQARALDVQILIYQVKRFLEKWSVFTNFVEENFKSVGDRTTMALSEIAQVRQTIHG